MLCTKEKSAMMNLIYKDYCKCLGAVNTYQDQFNVKDSTVNSDGDFPIVWTTIQKTKRSMITAQQQPKECRDK